MLWFFIVLEFAVENIVTACWTCTLLTRWRSFQRVSFLVMYLMSYFQSLMVENIVNESVSEERNNIWFKCRHCEKICINTNVDLQGVSVANIGYFYGHLFLRIIIYGHKEPNLNAPHTGGSFERLCIQAICNGSWMIQSIFAEFYQKNYNRSTCDKNSIWKQIKKFQLKYLSDKSECNRLCSIYILFSFSKTQ